MEPAPDQVIRGRLSPGTRLDRLLTDYCAQLLPHPVEAGAAMTLSRSRIKSLIEAGQVAVAGEIITDPSAKINAESFFTLVLPPPETPHNRGENIALAVIYEDDDLLVIDKPPGLVVHPAPGHREGTLVNALIHHCGREIITVGGVARPGIVHRLDKDTSGLLVAAKNDQAFAHLQRQFSAHTIERRYLALVWGLVTPKQGTISHSIGRSQINRQKMAVVTHGGRHAVTHYTRLQQWGSTVSLLECRLETGRTHQIRVHLSHVGHAVIGDPVYGQKSRNHASIAQRLIGYARHNRGEARGKLHTQDDKREDESGLAAESLGGKDGFSQVSVDPVLIDQVSVDQASLTQALAGFDRQALHAAKLGFIHPKSGDYKEFVTAPPKDFSQLIACLNQTG
ncbi:MAG: RluA family pseudouridine synthase [Candidatus Symbiobacter sp.]|nr:RluA family pseudouridine synthase [Candidatus Symbiobacter sp.]